MIANETIGIPLAAVLIGAPLLGRWLTVRLRKLIVVLRAWHWERSLDYQCGLRLEDFLPALVFFFAALVKVFSDLVGPSDAQRAVVQELAADLGILTVFIVISIMLIPAFSSREDCDTRLYRRFSIVARFQNIVLLLATVDAFATLLV